MTDPQTPLASALQHTPSPVPTAEELARGHAVLTLEQREQLENQAMVHADNIVARLPSFLLAVVHEALAAVSELGAEALAGATEVFRAGFAGEAAGANALERAVASIVSQGMPAAPAAPEAPAATTAAPAPQHGAPGAHWR